MYPHHLHTDRRIPGTVTGMHSKPGQLVEVILLKAEILHDIEAYVQQLEKARPPEAPALLADSASDSYLLRRHIDTAVNQAVARCQAYLTQPSPYVHRISADHVHEWEEKSIFLSMPPAWTPHRIDPLRDAIHNFIVYRSLQLFLSFADEKAAAMSDAMASDSYDDIAVHLSARIKPLTCGYHPFG